MFADRRVAILVGGHDRGLDYEPLADGIAARDLPTLVVTMPDCGPRIGKAVAARWAARVETVDASDLRAAVQAAYQWCRPDGVVLLSPAAPSFGQFRDYRERASAFADAAHACRT
jgi:UDP-N-acetylmuramoylalanine--D-glutamate ligase